MEGLPQEVSTVSLLVKEPRGRQYQLLLRQALDSICNAGILDKALMTDFTKKSKVN